MDHTVLPANTSSFHQSDLSTRFFVVELWSSNNSSTAHAKKH